MLLKTVFFYNTYLVGSSKFNIIPLFFKFEGVVFALNTITKYKRMRMRADVIQAGRKE